MTKQQRTAISKTEIAASQQRRRIKLLEIVLVIMLPFVIWVAWKWLQEQHSFPIKQISVVGDYEHLESDEVRNIILPLVQNSFFSVDLATMKQHLLRNAWIRDVYLERAFPDGLIVELTEYIPIARWGEHSLITEEGIIFTPDEHDLVYLPMLVGPHSSQMKMLAAYQQFQKLSEHELVMTQLQLSPEGSWMVTLNESFDLRLGRENVYQRFARFMAVFPELIASRESEIEYVDLRYESGLAVKWK